MSQVPGAAKPSRSHPPTLLTLVRRVLSHESPLPRGTHLLLAVSGGPDSMALLHVLERLRRGFGLLLSAHGVDHGLRPGAAAELDLAEQFAKTLGVPFSRSSISMSAGGNLQARAREARYAELRKAAARAQADLIATAHHADDRAETLLLRLLRGTGPAGLSVLPVRSLDLLRPMIRARRDDVFAHLQRHGVPYCHDASNQDPRFLRVRVRRELLPLLEELSPRIVEHLTSLADQAPSSGSPEIRDAEGVSVPLNRAQARELGLMSSRGALGARIALRGGREIRLDRATGRPSVVAGEARGESSGPLAAKALKLRKKG